MKKFIEVLTILSILTFIMMFLGGMIYCGFHEWTPDFINSAMHYVIRLVLIGTPILVILTGICKVIDDM